MAAQRPSSVAMAADSAATERLILAAFSIAASSSNAAYHFVEKPPQTVTSLDALKLIAARITIGP